MAPPKKFKKWGITSGLFEIQEAGPFREIFASLMANADDSNVFNYYVWFPEGKTHAIDWAVIHNAKVNYNQFGRFVVPVTGYEFQDPVRASQFVPDNNRTQIGIAMQKDGFFLVRFLVDSVDGRTRYANFMLNYGGTAPKDLVGKVFWGRLVRTGDTPGSIDFLSPPNQGQTKWSQ